MLGRVKNLVLTLGLLLALPVSSKYHSMIPGRVENPVLALELSKRHKGRTYIVSQRIIYAFFLLCLFGSAVFLLYSELFHLFSDASIFRSVVVLSHSDSYRPKLDILFLKLFGNVHNFAMVLMFLLLPAFAATSIVDERQRGTLMLVQSSLLRPFDIVWSKIVASVAPVLVPAGVSGFVWVFYLRSLMRDIGVGTGLWLIIAIIVPALFVLIPFAVSAVLVLVSTFGKSATASITVSYTIALILLSFASGSMSFLLIEALVDRTYCWSPPYSPHPSCLLPHVDCFPVRGFFDLCFGGEISAHPIVRYTYFMLVPVVYACAVGLSVRWACRRLRLPVAQSWWRAF